MGGALVLFGELMLKWARTYVVDNEPLEWGKCSTQQVSNIKVEGIMGLSSDYWLILPHDPEVIEVGVVVTVSVSSGPDMASSWVMITQDYPIFTNGDTYRRLSIAPTLGMKSKNNHPALCNTFLEDAIAFQLGKIDGGKIRAAIS
mgnify:CR=1 FL=1